MERLPNAENARIDPRKLRDYVLNPHHEIGRFKAAFFAQMGYEAGNWQRLEQDLRTQHLGQAAEPGSASPYGSKYAITAPLRGPLGTARQVTSVWIVRPHEDTPELVTIEPASRAKVG